MCPTAPACRQAGYYYEAFVALHYYTVDLSIHSKQSDLLNTYYFLCCQRWTARHRYFLWRYFITGSFSREGRGPIFPHIDRS